MTRTPNAAQPPTGETMTMQPSYALFIVMTPTEARPFIRSIFRLIQHFIVLTDLRGATNKTGYRLQHESSVCDFVYHYDAKGGGFQLQTQFKPGASNELAGRVLALVGLLISYHEATGKPLNLDMKRSNLHDLKTLLKWGKWATAQLGKKFPTQFPELAAVPEVKF